MREKQRRALIAAGIALLAALLEGASLADSAAFSAAQRPVDMALIVGLRQPVQQPDGSRSVKPGERRRPKFQGRKPLDAESGNRSFSVVRTLRRGLDEVAGREYVFHLLLGAWVFCFGATVGSFLNVVVYRLPAGKSLVRPGSRCPKCDSPIRAIHNIPILGWLILRGRCWDCAQPISPRYPLVETAVAIVCLLLAIVELFTQGGNLPARGSPSDLFGGILWARDLQFAGVYLLHAGLVCTLLGSALINYDGHRLPLSLILPPLIIAVVLPLWWPSLRPVPVAVAAIGAEPAWSLSLVEGLCGSLLGALLGAVNLPERNRSLPLMLIGAFLGWQAVAAIAALASWVQVISAFVRATSDTRWMYTTWLVIVALLWIVFWKTIVATVPALGAEASWPTLVLALALTGIASWLERRIESMVIAAPASPC